MREIVICAAEMKTPGDFYAAFLNAVEAPLWHGHNLDALWDSIIAGSINGIEPPYRLTITGVERSSEDCKHLIHCFVALVHEARENGTPVDIFLCES
jgi:RNAse (barnase) inhibitor barstar